MLLLWKATEGQPVFPLPVYLTRQSETRRSQIAIRADFLTTHSHLSR